MNAPANLLSYGTAVSRAYTLQSDLGMDKDSNALINQPGDGWNAYSNFDSINYYLNNSKYWAFVRLHDQSLPTFPSPVESQPATFASLNTPYAVLPPKYAPLPSSWTTLPPKTANPTPLLEATKQRPRRTNHRSARHNLTVALRLEIWQLTNEFQDGKAKVSQSQAAQKFGLERSTISKSNKIISEKYDLWPGSPSSLEKVEKLLHDLHRAGKNPRYHGKRQDVPPKQFRFRKVNPSGQRTPTETTSELELGSFTNSGLYRRIAPRPSLSLNQSVFPNLSERTSEGSGHNFGNADQYRFDATEVRSRSASQPVPTDLIPCYVDHSRRQSAPPRPTLRLDTESAEYYRF